MRAPHFEISAAVVRQLGEELVSDEVTALVELVKNAYDADANYVHVSVNTKDTLPIPGSNFGNEVGYITIDDDGLGMDRADIERGWLVISLSAKRAMKASGTTTPRGRVPLGDKGLGRLSPAKRLAKHGSYDAGKYTYPVRRKFRVREPLASSVLFAFSQFLARDAWDHDFSGLPK